MTRPLRVVVVDIAAGSGGGLTVLRSFRDYLVKTGTVHEWIFLTGAPKVLRPAPHVQAVALPKIKRSWFRRLIFDGLTGRRLIRSLVPDVVFSLQNTRTYGLSVPQVVYVHQPLPFQDVHNYWLWRRDERRLAVYQHLIGRVIKRSIRQADRTIVQTHWMREAILQQVGIEPGRVERVAPDLEDLSAYMDEHVSDRRQFFFPAGPLSYKNLDCIEKACRALRAKGVTEFRVLVTSDTSLPDPNIASIGQLPREEALRTLSGSTLVYPSLIESYGLPLAEARSLGRLVLASDRSYAREVLEGYPNAYFFDPHVPKDLARLMHAVIKGEIRRIEGNVAVEPSPTTGWGRVVAILEEAAESVGG